VPLACCNSDLTACIHTKKKSSKLGIVLVEYRKRQLWKNLTQQRLHRNYALSLLQQRPQLAKGKNNGQLYIDCIQEKMTLEKFSAYIAHTSSDF